MSKVSMTTIERLKKHLREDSLRAVIDRYHQGTEREFYLALRCAVRFAGRTDKELAYFRQHLRFRGERRGEGKIHTMWGRAAGEDRITRACGLQMIRDIFPRIAPAVLHEALETVEKFRGKGAGELRFISIHGRDPESPDELASFLAERDWFVDLRTPEGPRPLPQ